MPAAVALRPRTFSELFDAAFLLAREHFRALATLSALIAIPSIVLGMANAALFGPGLGARAAVDGTAMLRALPLSLVAMCWYFVGVGALLHCASAAYLGEPVDPAASLRRALGRAVPLVGAHVLAYLAALAVLLAAALALALAGGLVTGALAVAGLRVPTTGRAGVVAGVVVALGVVGAVLAIAAAVLARYVNISAVLMLEGGGATAALRRSSALSVGHRRRIVGLFAVLGAVSMAFAFTALGLGELTGNAYVANLVATLLTVPIYPLMACVLTALYYDLRIRKEGFDIAHAAEAIGRGTAAA